MGRWGGLEVGGWILVSGKRRSRSWSAGGGPSFGGCRCRWGFEVRAAARWRLARGRAGRGGRERLGASRAEVLAEKDGGLGVLVVARGVGVAAAAVHGDGGGEVVFAVEVEPVEAGGAGGGFEGVHEACGDVVAAEVGEDVETLALGGVGDGVERAVEDAAGDFCCVVGRSARKKP